MRTTFLSALVVLLWASMTSPAAAQAPAVTHNTWSTAGTMPTARFEPSAGAIREEHLCRRRCHQLRVRGSATLGGRLYCIGGSDIGIANIFKNVQIYQP